MTEKATHAANAAGRRYRMVRHARQSDVGDLVRRRRALADALEHRREAQVGSGVGKLELAHERHDESLGSAAQLKSAPLDTHAGGEFRFYLPHGLDGEPSSRTFDRLLREEQVFLLDRERIARVVSDTREAVQEAIARRPATSPPATIGAIGFGDGQGWKRSVCVELWTLGPDLRMGVERLPRSYMGDLLGEVDEMLAKHGRRADLLAELNDRGARGLMDETVPLILNAAGYDLDVALRDLQHRQDVRFAFGRRFRQIATLEWRDGSLKIDLDDRIAPLELRGDMLTVPGVELPEIVRQALPGRRLGALLEHPCLPRDATISSIVRQSSFGPLHVRLQIRSLAVPMAHGPSFPPKHPSAQGGRWAAPTT